VIRAIDMGAMGFVPKRASNDQLYEALRTVMSGGVYVPPMTMGFDVPPPEPAPVQPALQAVSAHAARSDYQTPPSLATLGLTPRQTDVLALL
ncbi:hypothetical protein LRN48_14375, partial [Staphylococcus aureus]|nr:hypothetical protein [Staphylococcus aureus]